ncbi:MAG: alpha/beta fold hydrolase, partial [Pseudomonadota bacterium]
MRQWGEGRCLLIHCSLSHSGTLARLAEALPGGARAFDLPGHGDGPAWDGGDYQAQAVAMAKAACPAPGPVFGHSFGGTVALRFAVENPDLVTSLTLVEPVFFAALRLHDAEAYAAHRATFAAIEERLETGNFHEAAELFTTMWGGAPWRLMPQRFKDGLAAQ